MRFAVGTIAAVAVALACAGPAAAAKLPKPELFGVRLGMPKIEADRQLGKIGRIDHEKVGASGAKQFWRLDDEHYAWAALRYDAEQRVIWVTLFARQDGKPVRYAEVGDLEKARAQGNYYYTWDLDGARKGERLSITARGMDPERLDSISLYRLKAAAE